ncbi:MAG: hypothetical protein FWG98_11955 [Candidatus Cloacimonetes bacterium]|nr:hypothetical protein [Candidatus Cloacimonadota bacterium]
MIKQQNIIIVLTLITTILVGQQIQLPTEDVFGTFATKPDSLNITSDFSEYYNLFNRDALAYQTMLENDIVKDTSKDPIFYAHLRANTYFLNDFHLGVRSRTNPIINFYAKYYHEKIDYYETYKSYAEWRPVFKTSSFSISPAVYFQLGFHDRLFFDSKELDSSMITTGLSLSYENYTENILNNIYFKTNFLVLDSINQDEYNWSVGNSLTSPELEFSINLDKFLFINETDIKIYNYYSNSKDKTKPFSEQFHYSSNFYLPVNSVNLFALNLQYSSSLFIPSILIEKSFYLNELSEFTLSNMPYMSVPSLFDYHNLYPFAQPFVQQYINDTKSGSQIEFAQQIPWNAFMKFNLFHPIELQIYLNSKFVKNLYVVNFDHLSFNNLENEFWKNYDVLYNSFYLDVLKRINAFTFGFDANYFVTNLSNPIESLVYDNGNYIVKKTNKLPWHPHFEFSPKVGFRYKKYNVDLKLEALTLRYDDLGDSMGGVYLLNNTHNLDISRNVKLSINLNNIFNEKYEKIYGMPEPEFNAEAIIKINF